MQTAKGTIKHENWNEATYYEAAGQKSTMAEIRCLLDGDVVAEAVTRYLMHYPDDTSAHYAGYLFIEGAVRGRSGSFAIYEVGSWGKGLASSRWEIVRGSGTGDLEGIDGTGSYAAEHDKTVRYELNYSLP